MKSFCHTFAERAFRRPLTADENKSVVDRQFEVAKDPEIAVKRVVLRTLTSPEFLYREIGREPDGYKVASRLSYGLWDSMPDQELLRAAASGQLSTKEQIAKQAERMLANPRAKAKIHEFLLTWTRADQPRDLTKDTAKFPGFDPAVISDLRMSLELFLDDVTWSDKSDFRATLARRHGFSQRPAGEILRGQSAARCRIHESEARCRSPGRRADASLFDGQLRP